MTGVLRDMVAGADFMPMVSETVSYRYSCSRRKCKLIPLRESQWILGKAKDDGFSRGKMGLCGFAQRAAVSTST